MESTSAVSFLPALSLLVILALLAWAAQWAKKRLHPHASGSNTRVRLVSQLMLGPQQKVVVVEIEGRQGPVQLTLGVTPQHVRTLHTQVGAAAPAPGSLPPSAESGENPQQTA